VLRLIIIFGRGDGAPLFLEGVTFTYGANGPEGLLQGKKVYFVAVSGGTPLTSEPDHMSPWLDTFFNFIGISDQTTIPAVGDARPWRRS
jgi:FMN-dependent NADH-azoreductase